MRCLSPAGFSGMPVAMSPRTWTTASWAVGVQLVFAESVAGGGPQALLLPLRALPQWAAPSLPPCPAARRWPLGLGSGTWESRSRGGEGKGVGVGGAGRLRSWGCLRQQGPGRGGKGGGGPGQQQPRRPAAGAARRSGGCRASPPVPFSLALRWEAGQREARRSLA